MAVANPKRPLKEGDILPYWPEAASKSQCPKVTAFQLTFDSRSQGMGDKIGWETA
jgi:hypothetical protein